MVLHNNIDKYLYIFYTLCMLEVIISSILGSIIGLGACGYINSINNQEAIEVLKHDIEQLKTRFRDRESFER